MIHGLDLSSNTQEQNAGFFLLLFVYLFVPPPPECDVWLCMVEAQNLGPDCFGHLKASDTCLPTVVRKVGISY